MNAKQFQELLKESENILRDEDFAPKDAPQITRERVPQQAESNDQDIERLLDDMLEVANEIISRIEDCRAAVQDDDREYMEKELSDLESVVSGATSDLEGSMQDIMMALDSSLVEAVKNIMEDKQKPMSNQHEKDMANNFYEKVNQVARYFEDPTLLFDALFAFLAKIKRMKAKMKPNRSSIDDIEK